jgi:3-hydroxybutyryl-CoA dehydrogenase
MAIRRVGVVGCGLMGSGIAEVCARAGYEVLVREISQELVERGLERVRGSLRRAAERGKASAEEVDAASGRLSGTTELGALADRDLVIEAVVENVEEKRQVFAALDAACPARTILLSNTSSLPVIEMAAATKRPDRVAGLHFFSPAPVMPLVELVRTIATSDETHETVRRFGESLGKRAIVARDTPAFIVNRLLVPYLMDAIRVYESGLASKEDIDAGMKLGCGHPMGPLALADFVGLDVCLFVAEAMHEQLAEPRFAPPPLLRRLVAAGWLGRKTGKGFYDY